MVLISVHPRFAEAIAQGKKTVEFRRRWTKREVSHLVIYATSPLKQIVAIAQIEEVVGGSPTRLWNLSKEQGGGITKRELSDYLSDLEMGFGIRLGAIVPLQRPIDPFKQFKKFHAPQSFRYLMDEEEILLHRIMRNTL